MAILHGICGFTTDQPFPTRVPETIGARRNAAPWCSSKNAEPQCVSHMDLAILRYIFFDTLWSDHLRISNGLAMDNPLEFWEFLLAEETSINRTFSSKACLITLEGKQQKAANMTNIRWI